MLHRSISFNWKTYREIFNSKKKKYEKFSFFRIPSYFKLILGIFIAFLFVVTAMLAYTVDWSASDSAFKDFKELFPENDHFGVFIPGKAIRGHPLGFTSGKKYFVSSLVKGSAAYMPSCFLAIAVNWILGIILAVMVGFYPEKKLIPKIGLLTRFSNKKATPGKKVDHVYRVRGLTCGEAALSFSHLIQSVPKIIGLLLILGIFYRSDNPNVRTIVLMISIGLFASPRMMETLGYRIRKFKREKFVDAAKAAGFSDFNIIFKQIFWKNCLPLFVVEISRLMAEIFIFEAVMAYLGLGIYEPYWSWGRLAQEEIDYGMTFGFIRGSLHPCLCIAFFSVGFLMLGDAIADIKSLNREG